MFLYKPNSTPTELLVPIRMFHNFNIDFRLMLILIASKQANVLHAKGMSFPGDIFRVFNTSAINVERGK